MGRYDYQELRAAAIAGGPAEAQALADWFEQYDIGDWDGESYDMDDDLVLSPIYSGEGDDMELVGWEVQ